MGLFDFLLGFQAESPFNHDPNDERNWRRGNGSRDYWDSGLGGGTASTGQYVRPDDAIGVSCMFLGVRMWAKLMGTPPIRFYRNRPNDEGEDQIYQHPLLPVLSPDGRFNPWMSGVMGRMWMEAQSVLWGLGLCEIKFGGYGLELWPIEAEHVTQIDQLPSGKKRYTIHEPGKKGRDLVQDEVFALEGFGTHRLIPESLLRRSREAVGVWLAQQQYRGSYFERGASPSIIFEHPGNMSDPAQTRFKASVQGRIGGLRNAHRVVVVEEGMKVHEFGHTARNAQLVEAWDAQAREIARFIDLPAYMLEVKDQLPYNSREQAVRELIDFRLRPKAALWEAAIKMHLITEPDIVCEIDLDPLRRGDLLTQAQTDAIYIMNGVDSENEVRRARGKNPIPGLDEPRRSVNQDRGGDPRQPRPGNPGDRETDESARIGAIGADLDALVPGFAASDMIDAALQRTIARGGANEVMTESGRTVDSLAGVRRDPAGVMGSSSLPTSRVQQILEAHARQILKRECEQLRRRAIQHAGNQEAWAAWLLRFYSQELAPMIQERLAVAEDVARAYTDLHRWEATEKGLQACDRWEEKDDAGRVQAIKYLVGMVLNEEAS